MARPIMIEHIEGDNLSVLIPSNVGIEKRTQMFNACVGTIAYLHNPSNNTFTGGSVVHKDIQPKNFILYFFISKV